MNPIFPSCMRKGPDGSILVFERMHKNIKQLRYSEGQFHLIKQLSTKFETIRSLCYSDSSGIVTVVKSEPEKNFLMGQVVWQHKETIAGIDLSMGNVVWQHDKELQLDSSTQSVNRIQDTLTLPDGRVCIVTYDAIFCSGSNGWNNFAQVTRLGRSRLYLGSRKCQLGLPTWKPADIVHSLRCRDICLRDTISSP